MFVHRGTNIFSFGETLVIHAVRQTQIAHFEPGADRIRTETEWAAILDWSNQFWIERFLRGHATREVNIDDRFCHWPAGGSSRSCARPGKRLQAKKIAQCQTETAHDANIEKFAAIGPPDVIATVAPGWFPITHSTRLF